MNTEKHLTSLPSGGNPDLSFKLAVLRINFLFSTKGHLPHFALSITDCNTSWCARFKNGAGGGKNHIFKYVSTECYWAGKCGFTATARVKIHMSFLPLLFWDDLMTTHIQKNVDLGAQCAASLSPPERGSRRPQSLSTPLQLFRRPSSSQSVTTSVNEKHHSRAKTGLLFGKLMVGNIFNPSIAKKKTLHHTQMPPGPSLSSSPKLISSQEAAVDCTCNYSYTELQLYLVT